MHVHLGIRTIYYIKDDIAVTRLFQSTFKCLYQMTVSYTHLDVYKRQSFNSLASALAALIAIMVSVAFLRSMLKVKDLSCVSSF